MSAEHPLPSFEELRDKAISLGWDDIGVTVAQISEADIASYRSWLADQYHDRLAYMENQLRCFPQEYFPGAQIAILFITNYKQERLPFREDAGLIASYARGRDYHNVHRKRLRKMMRWLEERVGERWIAKPFSDAAPVLEKALAAQSGLGWFGKNTLLIHRRFGTFFLLSGLLTKLPLPYAKTSLRLPRCGSCTRCLDACPTQAFVAPYRLNAANCLSYHLIESKEPLPLHISSKNPGYAFGCDICQDVCPHNVRNPLSLAPEFSPDAGMGAYLTLEKMEAIERQPELLRGTPLSRRGVAGLRNSLETIINAK